MNTAPALDARNQIPARLNRLGMSQRFFAEVCDVPQTEFSRLMSGAKPLTGSQTTDFYKMLDALEELVRLFDPCPVGWTDAKAVREFLRAPRFPHLFALIGDAALLKATPTEFAIAKEVIRVGNEKSARLEAEIAFIQEQTRKLFETWLGESHAR